MDINDAILGMEVRCPDGLGRISDIFKDHNAIEVETYFKNRSCHWDARNVGVWNIDRYMKLRGCTHSL